MISLKALMFVFFVFFGGNYLSHISEEAYLGAADVETLNQAMGQNVHELQGTGGTLAAMKSGVYVFTKAIPKALSWDYAYFEGDWEIVRWFLLTTVTGPFMIALSLLFMPILQGIWARISGIG